MEKLEKKRSVLGACAACPLLRRRLWLSSSAYCHLLPVVEEGRRGAPEQILESLFFGAFVGDPHRHHHHRRRRHRVWISS